MSHPPPAVPTRDEFRLFVCSKGSDIISSGAYKRHVIACRDNGDKWAESVQQGVAAVSAYSEYVRRCVMRVEELPTKELETAIREALSTSSPPCKVHKGVGVCRVTGLSSDACIDLTRSLSPSMGGGAADAPSRILVHPRLSHFFYMLWYSCKIEHVVRNTARDWMRLQDGTVLELCKRFESREGVIDNMYSAYVKACAHIIDSIEGHMRSHAEQLCIRPPPPVRGGKAAPAGRKRPLGG